MPRLSVLVRTRLRPSLLREALNSIQAQTFRDYEVLVLDDGPSVEVEALAAARGPAFRYLGFPHVGQGATLEQGLASARGEFIALLDDDDLWAPEFLSSCLAVLRSPAIRTCVYADYRFLDMRRTPARLRAPRARRRSGRILLELIRAGFIPPSSLVLPRACVPLLRIEAMPLSRRGVEDWELSLRLAAAGVRVHCIRRPLVTIRIHGGNFSRAVTAMVEEELEVLARLRAWIEPCPPAVRGCIEQAQAHRRFRLGRLLIQSGRPEEGASWLRRVGPHAGLWLRLKTAAVLRLAAWLRPEQFHRLVQLWQRLLGRGSERLYWSPGSGRGAGAPSPLHVVQVMQRLDLLGGGEQQVLALLEQFTAEQARVELVSLVRAEPSARLQDRLRGIVRTSFDMPWAGWRRPFEALRLLPRLVTFIRERPDAIIHTHSNLANILAGTAARLAGARCLVATMHGTNMRYAYRSFNGRPSWAHALVHGALDAWTARLADGLIAPCEATKTYLVKRLGVRAERVQVIYNGLDPDTMLPASPTTRQRVRGELGVPPEALVIGMVGHLFPVKGHRYLIDAARALLPRWPTLSVWMVGGEGVFSARALREQAEALLAQGRMRLLGDRDDVPQLLTAMDIVAVPSLSEGFPYLVLEALAAARPVVASRVGGIPEVIRHQETGLLVPPGDVAALTAALERLLKSPDEARRLGHNGRAVVVERFTRERMLHETRQLYVRLLRPSSGRGDASLDAAGPDAQAGRAAAGRSGAGNPVARRMRP